MPAAASHSVEWVEDVHRDHDSVRSAANLVDEKRSDEKPQVTMAQRVTVAAARRGLSGAAGGSGRRRLDRNGGFVGTRRRNHLGPRPDSAVVTAASRSAGGPMSAFPPTSPRRHRIALDRLRRRQRLPSGSQAPPPVISTGGGAVSPPGITAPAWESIRSGQGLQIAVSLVPGFLLSACRIAGWLAVTPLTPQLSDCRHLPARCHVTKPRTCSRHGDCPRYRGRTSPEGGINASDDD